MDKTGTKTSRRLVRFGIRGLLLLTVVAAIASAWLAKHRAEWVGENKALASVSKHVSYAGRSYVGPHLLYRIGFRPQMFYRITEVDIAGGAPGKIERMGDPPNPYRLLNDETFASIAPELLRFKHLDQFSIAETRITDKSAPIIEQFSDASFINIQGNDISSATITQLESKMLNTTINSSYRATSIIALGANTGKSGAKQPEE